MTTETLFETYRSRLFALAYRLLGTRMDAEDVVQDAWLRWRQADRGAIEDAQAWLVTTTTRLGIDRLRRARNERETYTGPWLPEPLEVADTDTPQRGAEIAQQVSLAFLALLERLGPEQRAAFLLKEVFDYDYAQIAGLIGQSEANCRQMVHRARMHLQSEGPRFAVTPDRHRRLLESFMHAIQAGDKASIMQLLDTNARLISDGGGKVTAARRPLHGAERIARLYWAVARRSGTPEYRIGSVNGEPALLRWQDGQLRSITTLTVDGDRITQVLTVMNPDKLRGLH